MNRMDVRRLAQSRLEQAKRDSIEDMLSACQDALQVVDDSVIPAFALDDIRQDVQKSARKLLCDVLYSSYDGRHVDGLEEFVGEGVVRHARDVARCKDVLVHQPSLDAFADLFDVVYKSGQVTGSVRFVGNESQIRTNALQALAGVKSVGPIYDKVLKTFSCLRMLSGPGDDIVAAEEQVKDVLLGDFTCVLDFLVLKSQNPGLVNAKLHATYKGVDPEQWPLKLQRVRDLRLRHAYDITLGQNKEAQVQYDQLAAGTLFDVYPGDHGYSCWHANNMTHLVTNLVALQSLVVSDLARIVRGASDERVREEFRVLKGRLAEVVVPRLDAIQKSRYAGAEEPMIASTYLCALAKLLHADVDDLNMSRLIRMDANVYDLSREYGFFRDIAGRSMMILDAHAPMFARVGEGDSAAFLLSDPGVDRLSQYVGRLLEIPQVFVRGFYDA